MGNGGFEPPTYRRGESGLCLRAIMDTIICAAVPCCRSTFELTPQNRGPKSQQTLRHSQTQHHTQSIRAPLSRAVYIQTPHDISRHLSRWSSVLISSHLPILCRSFALFGYLLTCGGVLSLASQSAYTLQASVGMVSAPTAGPLSALAGWVILPAIQTLTLQVAIGSRVADQSGTGKRVYR